MVEPRDITARLLDRAKEDRQCAENNKAVFDAFSEQMRLFESREGHNVYAVRMAVDHKSGMERDTRYAADLEEAAAEITRLRAEVERLQQRCADWAASYGEKSSDLEDLKRQNAELADARIADGFSRYDAVETARAEAMERAAQIAEQYLAMGWRGSELPAAIRAEASKKGSGGK